MIDSIAMFLHCGDSDLDCSRWRGPLDSQQLSWCRERGVPVGYDPAQIGWVILESVDQSEKMAAAAALRLRRWRRDDVPAFCALLDDPEVWRHLPEPYPAPVTEALARDLVELSQMTDHHDVRAIDWGGSLVGQVRLAFTPGCTDRTSGEISYWLGRRWWGQGVASAAIRRFTGLCFVERPGLVSIVARVHRDNVASARALARAGYLEEGNCPDDPAIRLFRQLRGSLQAADQGVAERGPVVDGCPS